MAGLIALFMPGGNRLPEDDNMVYDFAYTAAVQAVCIGVVRPGGRLAVLMPALLHKNT